MITVWDDAGHGGKDSGACGNGLKEKDITLSVSNKVNALLKQAGMDAKTTRTTDVFYELSERTNMANKADADLLMSIHVNAGGGKGIGIWHSVRCGKGQDGNKLATIMLSKMVALGFNDYGVRTREGNGGEDYYHMIRRFKNPKRAIIIEMGFIDSIIDTNLLKQAGMHDKLAKAIADSVLEFYGIQSKPTTPVGKLEAPAEQLKVLVKNDIIGDSAYWLNVTAGKTVANPKYIETMIVNSKKKVGPLGIDNNYWASVIDGKTVVTADNVNNLIRKIAGMLG